VSDYDELEAGGLPTFLWNPAGVVRRRWRWMLAALLVGLLATGMSAALMKKRYVAGATVMIATQEMPEDFVRSTVRGDPFQRINAMIGEVLARRNLTALIEEHGLYPELVGAVPLAEIAVRMRGDITIGAEEGIEGRSRFETARLLRIEYQSVDPDTAALIANRLAGLLVDEGIRLRSHQAALAANFMTGELERAERELRAHVAKITEFKQQHRGELPADLEPSLRALSRLQEQRESFALQIAETETRLASLSTSDNDSPEAQLQQLKVELADELSKHTEKHPDVISLRRRIEQAEALVKAGGGSAPGANPVSLVSSGRRTLDELRRQRSAADARIRELEERVARIPERQEAIEALEQKEGVLQATYTEFLRKVQEAELAQSLELAQQGARISFMEQAERPRHPTRERWKVVGAGLFASLVIAFAVGLLFELIDPVLLLPSDARFVEDVPILGSVPWIH
jgi:uncharacterized protein involved in exopolysaccharide biosynthesis